MPCYRTAALGQDVDSLIIILLFLLLLAISHLLPRLPKRKNDSSATTIRASLQLKYKVHVKRNTCIGLHCMALNLRCNASHCIALAMHYISLH